MSPARDGHLVLNLPSTLFVFFIFDFGEALALDEA